MKLVVCLTFVIALAFSVLPVFGQDTISILNESTKKYAKYLDFSVEDGIQLSDNSEFGDMVSANTNYNGMDIRLGFRKTNPNDVYSTIYRRPHLGIGFYASTFKNEVIGTPNAFYSFMTIPFTFERNKKFTFDYTTAFGISYRFNAFDSIQNPTNVFLGSNLNCYVNVGFIANYKFSEKWKIYGSTGLKHFSNGSIKRPNNGVNLIPFTLGVSYKISKDEIEHFPKPVPTFIKHNRLNLRMAFGSKNYVNNGPNYLKMTMGVNYLRAANHRYRIGLGMDFFYSDAADLRTESGNAYFSDYFSYAIIPNWEWVISKRLYVPVGLGIYLHQNSANDERKPYYERIGICCNITEHIVAGLTIKAHKNVADYFEWTFGYTFHKDPNKY